MALVTKQNKRLPHPSEPDAWFVVRVPLTVGDMEVMGAPGNPDTLISFKICAIERSLIEWSYPLPLTPEAIRDLDVDTFNWLVKEIFASAQLRDTAEKKDSDSSSPPITEPATESGRKSSGI